jgi:hypothetical protein
MPPRSFASVLTLLIRLCRVGFVAALVLSVGGCIVLPIPTAATAPRYTPTQLESVRKDTVTQKSVETELLGLPDFRLEAKRIWIYGWTVYSGKWFMGDFLPNYVGGAVVGHVSSTAFLLVLEFDADGILRSKEFAHEVRGGRDRFCTERELCIEHPVLDMITIDGKMDTEDPHEVYRSGYSAVTVKGKARDFAGSRPQPDECLLVIWPTEEWNHKDSWNPIPRIPGGLALTIEGAQWPRHAWLPAEAFAVLSMSPGTHAIYAVLPYDDENVICRPNKRCVEESAASFECKPGEYAYLAIGRSEENNRAIVLRSIDAATAQALIADMPEVLVP